MPLMAARVEGPVARRIYCLRVALGAAVGAVSGALRLAGASGVLLAAAAYVAAHYAVKLRYGRSLPPRHYMIGLPEFVGLWLTLWSVVYTLLSP